MIQPPTTSNTAAVGSLVPQGVDINGSRASKPAKSRTKKRTLQGTVESSIGGKAKKRRQQVLPSQPEAAESVFRPAESSNLASKKLKGLLVDPSVNLASQRHLSKDAVSTAHSLLISSVHPLAPVSPHGPPELSSSLENPCCSSTASCPVSPDAPVAERSLPDISQRAQPLVPAIKKSAPGLALPKPVRKRFLKLIVAKTPLVFSSRAVEAPQDTCAMDPPKPTCSPVLHHLDFPAPMPVPQLPSITLPPSLSQRKRVQHWAIILSGLTDAERRCCVLVSRMLRYAGNYNVSGRCSILDTSLTAYTRSVPLGLAYTQAAPRWP